MRHFPTYKPFGESAILIEWQATMSDAILQDIIAFDKVISENEFVIETVQSINSITVIYHKKVINFGKIKFLLENIYKNSTLPANPSSYIQWEIPVCYEPVFGLDMEEFAMKKGLSIEEVISHHTSNIYRVYSIGFLPGFLYLGGLDKRLHADRKNNPRLEIPSGSVGIGGVQTGIYPTASPGGWQIIGNTPVPLFDRNAHPPCFAKAGDYIQFVPITHSEHKLLSLQIDAGTFTLKQQQVDG